MTPSTPRRKPIGVIYARLSQAKDGDTTTVEDQVEEITEEFNARGIEVAAVVIDNNTSATRGHRTDFWNLLATLDVDDGPWILGAIKADRTNRSNKEVERIIEVGQRRKLTILTTRDGDFDLSKPSGRRRFRVEAANAQGEVETLSERLTGKYDKMRGRGLYAIGGPRFGWTYAPAPIGEVVVGSRATAGRKGPHGRAFDLHPVQSELIRKGIEALLAGDSINSIARRFNASGEFSDAPGKREIGWRTSSIRAILCRWRNAGYIEHNGQPVFLATDWEPIPGITIEHIRAVRRIFDERSTGKRSGGRAPTHLLSALAFCSCGLKMRSANRHENGVRRDIYRCKTKGGNGPTIPGTGHTTRIASQLDGYVRSVIADALSDDGPALLELLTPANGDAAALRQEEERIELYLKNMAARHFEMDPDEHRIATEAARARRKVVQAELASLTRRSATVPFLLEKDPGLAFLGADPGAQRAVINELCEIHLLRGSRTSFDPTKVVFVWKPDGYDGPARSIKAPVDEHVCEMCGKTFTTRVGQVARCCSDTCRMRALRARRPAVPRTTPAHERTCEFCGKTFAQTTRGRAARYCSERHRMRAYRERKAAGGPLEIE